MLGYHAGHAMSQNLKIKQSENIPFKKFFVILVRIINCSNYNDCF
jgi:hypothetical protein